MAQTNDTSVRQQIRVLNQQMEDAFNANDMLKVAAFYSDDGEVVYPNGYTVKGRDGLNNYWNGLKDKGRGWDGTMSGRKQPVGVYTYALRATLQDGTTVQKRGTITIVR